MPRTRPLVCLAVFAWTAAVSAQKPASDPAGAIVRTSGPAMLAVARLIVEETWNPVLDKRVQESPAARSLGAAWTSADPRWQKARATLAARMTNLLESYAASRELTGHVQTVVGQIGPGANLDGAVAALTGPAGAALVREESRKNYIVTTLTARPDGPQVGSPEWNAQIRDAGKRFDEGIGASLPRDDGSQRAELERIVSGPFEGTLTRIWSFPVDNAVRQLNTAMNLMMFDNQAAIERDIASAVGPKGAAATAGGARPTDAFSLERMATCQDSWLEWGNDEARVGAFRDGFRAQFKESEAGGYFEPIASATLMGLKVARVYSSTIGMARGFSVAVDAPFDTAKKGVEKSLGKPLQHCETSDGMRTCDLTIADKKTVMLMGDATGKEKTTLVGCFYFYEK